MFNNAMKPKQYKSLKLNMALNAVKSMMNILFPLITFPYISKVLGINNVGKYNFASSVISYFILFAELGISTYAIREGAKIRNSGKFNSFANEIFSINVISTIASYALLTASLICVPKFQEYRAIMLVLSMSIAFKTYGMEWIYSIYEDYLYITLRSIFFQIISLTLLFVFVRRPEDLLGYVVITVVSSVGTGIMNHIRAKKYCQVSFTARINWDKHLKPILILFGMSATVAIYVNSDITILGFLCTDSIVGRYSVSVKIYSLVKTILSSVLVVSIPRISAILGENNEHKLTFVLSDIYKTLLTFILPAIVGLILLSKSIVLLISNIEYIEAASSLVLLSVALFFCMGAWFWGQCVLVPVQEEKKVFIITVISALVNIILNFILIPVWQEKAAAFTTILSEGLSYVFCMYCGRKSVRKLNLIPILIKVGIGCMGIATVCIISSMLIRNVVMNTIFSISISIIVYLVIEIMLKNEIIYGGTAKLVRIFRNKR